MGDFNLPKIDWELTNCLEDKIHKPFLTFVVESGLIQFVDFPTRDSNVLDVVLADDEQIISQIAWDPPIGNSDRRRKFINLSEF